MQIGIKIYPEDLAYAKKIARYADFFEVMAIPKSDFRKLKVLKKPFTIHNIHAKWGFNPADPYKAVEINKLGADTAAEAADILNADIIVVHPGYLETEDCSIKHTIRFMKRLDSRFILENVTAENRGFAHVGNSVDQVRKIMRQAGKGFCLDFPHAAEYAHSQGIDYIKFIKSLLRLKPKYFHISDTHIQNKKDLHLHLKEGDLNLDYLKSLVPQDSRILIETAHEFRKQHSDISYLRKQ